MTTTRRTLIFDDVQYLAECRCGWSALFMDQATADAAADDHFNEHGPDQSDFNDYVSDRAAGRIAGEQVFPR